MADRASRGSSDGNLKAHRARRVTRACDYCHRRSIRCRIDNNSLKCQNCVSFAQPCTYARPIQRRGAKPRNRQNSTATTRSPEALYDERSSSQYVSDSSTREALLTSEIPPVRAPREVRPIVHSLDASSMDQGTESSWVAPQLASQAVIMDLIEIYFDVVYPIFPLFHRPTLLRRISRGEYGIDQSLFVATMALCALAAARVRDGAVYDLLRYNTHELGKVGSETFYEAAVSQWKLLEHGNDHNVIRACGLLAIVAIQDGKIQEMQQHLGRYHTLVAMYRLHDEDNWPQDMGIVEREERRRTFWSMYQLDVFTSTVFNGVVRCRDSQSSVSYPAEIDDELFSNAGYTIIDQLATPLAGPSPSRTDAEIRSGSWLCGWNFITDLWRILENAVNHFRDRRLRKRSFLDDIFGEHREIDPATISGKVIAMYNNLPHCFKETPPITCDANKDRYGFQAANITATVQLLRMILFASGGSSIDERCQIGSEVVAAFTCIPTAYLRAISSPLLHHLAGIGGILGSVFEEPLNDSSYQRVRTGLLSLAQLLENLDECLHSTATPEQLRAQIARIDNYMQSQRVNVGDIVDEDSDEQIPTTAQGYSIEHVPVQDSSAPPGVGEQDLSTLLQLPPEFLDAWPWTLGFENSLGWRESPMP